MIDRCSDQELDIWQDWHKKTTFVTKRFIVLGIACLEILKPQMKFSHWGSRFFVSS